MSYLLIDRSRKIAVGIVAVLAMTLLVAPASPAHADPVQCPDAAPVSAATAGVTGQGYTVRTGTTPEPFTAEVKGVLDDAIAPGIDMIIAELSSDVIDFADLGVWAGMSGSPVYLPDGRLLGSVSYGFSAGIDELAGITPAENLAELVDRDVIEDEVETTIEVPTGFRRQLAAEYDVAPRDVATIEQLPVPLVVAGAARARQGEIAKVVRERGANVVAVPGAGGNAAGLGRDDITAGGNIAAALSYGDATLAGIGTTTLVCDGRAVAFGHPFLAEGRVTMSLHPAAAVDVARDPTLGSYKLANPGPPVGVIDIDGTAGIRGLLDREARTIPLTSTITNETEGRSRDGRTDIVYRDFIDVITLTHLWANWDTRVNDDVYYAGTADINWTITGTDADGQPWTLRRDDRVASADDLSTEASLGLANFLYGLQTTGVADVDVADIDYTGAAVGTVDSARVVTDQVTAAVGKAKAQPIETAEVTARPGQVVKVTAPVRDRRGQRRVVDVRVRAPFLSPGPADLIVGGDEPSSQDFCGFAPDECVDYGDAGFGDILALQQDKFQGDELVARIIPGGGDEGGIEDEFFGEGSSVTAPGAAAVGVAPAGAVVEGQAFGFATVAGSCPGAKRFVDVSSSNVHSRAVSCAGGVGIVNGVRTSPPAYAPARDVTRGEASSLIARALEFGGAQLPAPSGAFSDVDGSAHADAIRRLNAAGIVNGVTAQTFSPNAPIRRDQIASILIRAYEWARDIEPYRPATAGFSDVPRANVHAGAINTAETWGLVQGRSSTAYAPAAKTRRDQMATLVMRMVDALPLRTTGK